MIIIVLKKYENDYYTPKKNNNYDNNSPGKAKYKSEHKGSYYSSSYAEIINQKNYINTLNPNNFKMKLKNSLEKRIEIEKVSFSGNIPINEETSSQNSLIINSPPENFNLPEKPPPIPGFLGGSKLEKKIKTSIVEESFTESQSLEDIQDDDLVFFITCSLNVINEKRKKKQEIDDDGDPIFISNFKWNV